MFVFIDESGDLGLSKRSSKFFVLTAVIVDEPKKLERLTKAVRKGLRKKHRNIKEFHARTDNSSLRNKILFKLAAVPGIHIRALVWDKKRFLTGVNQDVFYLDCVTRLINLLFDGKFGLLPGQNSIFLDRKYNDKKVLDRFENSLRINLQKRQTGIINIKSLSSETNSGLQVTDFASWAIFRRYESFDEKYFEQIKNVTSVTIVAKKKTPSL